MYQKYQNFKNICIPNSSHNTLNQSGDEYMHPNESQYTYWEWNISSHKFTLYPSICIEIKSEILNKKYLQFLFKFA